MARRHRTLQQQPRRLDGVEPARVLDAARHVVDAQERTGLAKRLHDHADVSRHGAPYGALHAQGYLGDALQAAGNRLPVHRTLRQQRADRQ